jgi:hypothetical protein|tara:strand:- start:1763 stop:2017 length:255 start_codon:yes stop_codon:yes gene_type:complete
MIQYNKIKVSAKVKAKHTIADYLMKVFDGLKHNPLDFIDDWETMTNKEQEAVIDQVSLFEDRILKLLGVKLKEIISANNFSKSI